LPALDPNPDSNQEIVMTDDNPAMIAARASWSAVQRKAKDEWLDLMTEDVLFQDPIGVSPLDATGKGHVGKQAVSAFWDKTMAPATISIEVHRSFTAGQESAHLMTLTTDLPGGTRSIVTGIFTYLVDDEGKLAALRGYWDMADMKFEQSEDAAG
jgi:ketosteroid isomerase-like protein